MIYEYKVRPVVRYIVTRYAVYGPDEGGTEGSSVLCECQSEAFADDLCAKMQEAEKTRAETRARQMVEFVRAVSPYPTKQP
jgi:hypothetical protein